MRDVDMAEEMANFSRAQILMQASTAMMAQANAKPQAVLQLLS
ncbi:MAG: flagellin [Bacillota bacterium]